MLLRWHFVRCLLILNVIPYLSDESTGEWNFTHNKIDLIVNIYMEMGKNTKQIEWNRLIERSIEKSKYDLMPDAETPAVSIVNTTLHSYDIMQATSSGTIHAFLSIYQLIPTNQCDESQNRNKYIWYMFLFYLWTPLPPLAMSNVTYVVMYVQLYTQDARYTFHVRVSVVYAGILMSKNCS